MKSRVSLLLCLLPILFSCSNKKSSKHPDQPISEANVPARNPYLAAEHYSITHFNSAQTDAFPYRVKNGTFHVDLSQCEGGWSGPVNLMTLSSVNSRYMWGMSSDRVSYYDIKDGAFKRIGEAELPRVRKKTEDELKVITASYNSKEELHAALVSILGQNPQYAMACGNYVLCDKDNYAYTNAMATVARYCLKNAANPQEGIVLDKQLNLSADLGGVRTLVGMVMTYDGYLVVAFENGIAIVDRALNGVKDIMFLPADQELTNSIAVDEHNGIYLASNNVAPEGRGLMQKIVWTGSKLSDSEADGAWKAEYDGGPEAPSIKMGCGTGSTPSLMGFGDDEDKLVVITDGSKRMKLVAFWRDEIPEGVVAVDPQNPRIAGEIEVNCGLPESTEWIQSEQSVVVAGYGAFVVNNISATTSHISDKIVGVLSIGPLADAPTGVERLQWNVEKHVWERVWSRADVRSISMIPSVSTSSNLVFVNGYYSSEGWEVTGLDWNTGDTKHRVILGNTSRGNGAYAIIQYFENGDLLFNSVGGPYRVKL